MSALPIGSNLDLVAAAVENGMNVILSAPFGSGIATNAVQALEDQDLNFFVLAAPNLEPTDLQIPIMLDGKVEFYVPQYIADADALVFDNMERVAPNTLEIIEKLMESRTLGEHRLPNLQSVITLFSEPADQVEITKLQALAPTLSIVIT